MRVPMVIPWSLAPGFVALIFLTRTKVFGADLFSEALLGLKSEIEDGSNRLYDWSLPSGESQNVDISACSWSGITCNENSSMIIGLDLSQKYLSGSISGKHIKVLRDLVDLNLSQNAFSGLLPTELLGLTNLRSLDISRNDFTGAFPIGFSALKNLTVLDAFSNSFSGWLPPDIAPLDSLKVLNLAGSYFQGPIPPEYGSFRSLEFLHLAGNLLGGEIPRELGCLQKVTHMEIGYNYYEGSIPWQLGNMSDLQYLDIAQANLSGPIPNQLGNLTKLQTVYLFRNQLTGSIPMSFGNIKPLMSIDLSDNHLSGSIPRSFADLKNLRLLSLMYNDLSGSVPEEIADLPLLDTLLVWNNFFSGPLPQRLGKNSQLKWVDVSSNGFTGIIPSELCAGGKLSKLMLFSNKFTGRLSPALSNCSSLVRLRVENNSFSGSIPLKFGLLSNISFVDLSRNKLIGGIPTEISQATKLQYFNVSENPDLGGTVPQRMWSLPLLHNFSAFSCNISGDLPPFDSCKSISVIELKRNNLTGPIPRGIANCQLLETVILANNKLTGYIPPEIASLPTLSVIDLSHNDLTGPIPTNLENSSSLVLLNVSYNDISGSVPSEKTFMLMGTDAFVGNPKLCGAPLQSCAESKDIPRVAGFRFGSKTPEKITWVILCSGVVLFVMVSVFGILYLNRRSRGQWKMFSFTGLPQFTANDILRSLSYSSSVETVPSLSGTFCKAFLPTGITVAVKRIEWEVKRKGAMSEFITLLGNARHKNLIRLLGFCSNKHLAYLLYDYMPNGNLAEKMKMKSNSTISTWEAKYKIVIGVARGLCYLHHDCHPAIPHGDLRTSNVVFDESMEPHLADFGLRHLLQMNGSSLSRKVFRIDSMQDTGETDPAAKEEICRDIYCFGELLLEILTNGRLTNGGEAIQSKPRDIILREIYDENEDGDTDAIRGEIKLFIEVALLCTRSMPSDRPSMAHVLRLLSGLMLQRKH